MKIKFLSDCSGECCVCFAGGKNAMCVAGHGDDDYYPATTEQVIERLEEGSYKNYRDTMIQYLKDRGVSYKEETIKCTKNSLN